MLLDTWTHRYLTGPAGRQGSRKRAAFPAAGLQPIDEGMFVGNAERFGVRAQILAYMPEFDVSIQAPPKMHKRVAILDGPCGIGDQDADARIGLREHEVFHDFEKIQIVVNTRFKIVRINGKLSLGLMSNIDDGPTHFILR